jgi:hypothetical protein
VAGFASEDLVGYFDANIKTLGKAGIPRNQISVIKPSSKNFPEKNARELDKQFRALKTAESEPLVIVAHSKGAVETLIWALQNAEFVRDSVRAIFMVQGAFGGSPVADYLLGLGHPVDDSMPEKYRIALKGMAPTLGGFVDREDHDGLESLEEKLSEQRWPQLAAQFPHATALIAQKIFYIQGEEDVSKMSLGLRASGSYMATYYGKNDGLVPFDNQVVPGIGQSILVAETDHGGLFFPRPYSNTSAKTRASFTRFLLNYLELSP